MGGVSLPQYRILYQRCRNWGFCSLFRCALLWLEVFLELVEVIFTLGANFRTNAPITTETLAFTFHVFSTSFFSSWYFSIFSYSFFIMFLHPFLISGFHPLPQYLADWLITVCLPGWTTPTGPSPFYSPRFLKNLPSNKALSHMPNRYQLGYAFQRLL